MCRLGLVSGIGLLLWFLACTGSLFKCVAMLGVNIETLTPHHLLHRSGSFSYLLSVRCKCLPLGGAPVQLWNPLDLVRPCCGILKSFSFRKLPFWVGIWNFFLELSFPYG